MRPGDIVIADRDGVTVVPLDDGADIADQVAALMEREEKRIAEIAKGVLVRPEIDEALRRMRVID